MNNVFYHTECLICKSHNLKRLKNYESNYLVKCSNCGFVFSKKIPTIQELNNVYDSYGRDDYLSQVTIKRYNEILDVFEKYRKNNKIFDIGCGIGYFLEQAKKRGWEVYGTEFSDKAVDICKAKGITTYKGKITDINFDNSRFDVITSFEVIEHINNPLEEIAVYYNLLRKGGVFYLTTPNFNAIERFVLKENYNIIAYPEHLSYYTSKTINYLFTKNGFKKLKLETTGISITRLKSSMKKSTGSKRVISPISEDEIIRNKLENNKILLLAKILTNKMLTILGVGNNIKALYQKL